MFYNPTSLHTTGKRLPFALKPHIKFSKKGSKAEIQHRIDNPWPVYGLLGSTAFAAAPGAI